MIFDPQQQMVSKERNKTQVINTQGISESCMSYMASDAK